MMKQLGISQKAFLCAGGLCILATIVVTALINPWWTPMSIATFIGLIWAEIILFGGLFLLGKQVSKGSSVFLRIGGGFVIALFAAAVFVTSIFFFPLPSLMISGFIAAQIVFLVVFACAMLLIFFLDKKFRASDEMASSGIAYVVRRSGDVSACVRECMDSKLRQRLNRCADDLKFMDSAVRVQADTEIDKRIESIRRDLNRADDAQASVDLAADINGLELAIASRKEEMALLKRGGF